MDGVYIPHILHVHVLGLYLDSISVRVDPLYTRSVRTCKYTSSGTSTVHPPVGPRLSSTQCRLSPQKRSRKREKKENKTPSKSSRTREDHRSQQRSPQREPSINSHPIKSLYFSFPPLSAAKPALHITFCPFIFPFLRSALHSHLHWGYVVTTHLLCLYQSVCLGHHDRHCQPRCLATSL